MLSKEVGFKSAVPVWARGLVNEMNVSLNVERAYGAASARFRIAANSCYQLFVDGELYAMGPARAGHGYYRVDEHDLPGGSHRIRVIVAGYNNNAFEYVDEPPFICAELEEDGAVTAATSVNGGGFEFRVYTERIQKTQRFSFQRNFAEAYDLTRPLPGPCALTAAVNNEIHFIERGVPLYKNEREDAKYITLTGVCGRTEPAELFADRAITGISGALKGFKPDELEVCTAWEAQKLSFFPKDASRREMRPDGWAELEKDGFALFETERNLCGVICFDIDAGEECTVFAMFDEICGGDGDINFLRLGTSSAVIWKIPAGKHTLLSFEPYVFKYLKIAVTGSACRLGNVHIKRVGFYRPDVRVVTGDEKIKAIFDAALETFRQNTYDIYMDCASRERAGWLCDSFFTSRVEYALTGKCAVERNFLENFLQPRRFRCLPDGMLPMCYPSDHYDGVFIPNWAMWYCVELEEYLKRSGDRELADRAKDRLYSLFTYFSRFENEEGLLEKLESWIFVEWSRSNQLVMDVNFPTNMLYVRAMRAMAAVYGDAAFSAKADRLAERIIERSYNGRFFCDNLLRRGGELVPSGECTESCQYYAFHTGVASPEDYPELWRTLVHDFGPMRKESGLYPEIAFSNAFVGNYLRLDLFDRFGLKDKLIEDIKGYFYHMAEKTGTLWENDGAYASCSHGFASHVIYWFDRLGMLEKGK